MYTRAKKILASELMYALDMEEDEAEAHLEELIAEAHASSRTAREAAGHRQEPRGPGVTPDVIVVGIIPAGGSGERLGADRPKAFVVCAGRPLSSGASTCSDAVCDRVIVAPPGRLTRPPAGSRAALVALGVGAQRAGGGARGHGGGGARRRPAARHRASWSSAAPALAGRGRGDRRGADDRHGQGGGPDGSCCARSTARAVGRPDAAGLPGRRRCGGRSTSTTPSSQRRPTTRRWWRPPAAPCAWSRRRPTTSRSRRAADLRARRGARPVLTDYHVHLRPDEDGLDGRALLHGGERRPLPRGGRGARHRGARRGRAHPPLRAVARDLVARLVSPLGARRRGRVRATSCAARACRSAWRPTSCPGARTAWPASSTSASGTTWSARCTSCATRPSTSTAEPGWEPWDIWRAGDPDKVWARYFETLGEAARTGLFDVLAHPDLVKV